MQSSIKIGEVDRYDLQSYRLEAINKLEAQSVEVDSIKVAIPNFHDPYEAFSQKIKSGEIDIAVLELSDIPISYGTDEVIITGLSERREVGEGILCKKGTIQGHLSTIENTLKIGVTNRRQGVQLNSLFENIQFLEVPNLLEQLLNQRSPSDIDGLIVSKNLIYSGLLDMETYDFIYIHPKELIPTPGQGFMAYICHREDIATRKIVNLIHHKPSVYVANTERELLKLCGENDNYGLGAYCNTDVRGYFHFTAVRCDAYRRASFSQSIAKGLSEIAYNELFKN